MWDVPHAIMVASNRLRPGDLILVEQQLAVLKETVPAAICRSVGTTYILVPVESIAAVADAVRVATAAGISVIMTASNDAGRRRRWRHQQRINRIELSLRERELTGARWRRWRSYCYIGEELTAAQTHRKGFAKFDRNPRISDRRRGDAVEEGDDDYGA